MTVFDKNKKTISKSSIEMYSDIILLIKLQDIWINTEKSTIWIKLECFSM